MFSVFPVGVVSVEILDDHHIRLVGINAVVYDICDIIRSAVHLRLLVIHTGVNGMVAVPNERIATTLDLVIPVHAEDKASTVQGGTFVSPHAAEMLAHNANVVLLEGIVAAEICETSHLRTHKGIIHSPFKAVGILADEARELPLAVLFDCTKLVSIVVYHIFFAVARAEEQEAALIVGNVGDIEPTVLPGDVAQPHRADTAACGLTFLGLNDAALFYGILREAIDVDAVGEVPQVGKAFENIRAFPYIHAFGVVDEQLALVKHIHSEADAVVREQPPDDILHIVGTVVERAYTVDVPERLIERENRTA